MTIVLRVAPLALASVDAHLAQLPAIRMIRTDAGVDLECPDAYAEAALSLLARAGARTVSHERMPEPSPGLVPAIVGHLLPLRAPGIFDSVAVRCLHTGEAATRLLPQRPSLFGRRHREMGPLRAVLRGDDRLLAWRRVVWAQPTVLRSRQLRGARPVVFDRDALVRARERHSLMSAGELMRWMIA